MVLGMSNHDDEPIDVTAILGFDPDAPSEPGHGSHSPAPEPSGDLFQPFGPPAAQSAPPFAPPAQRPVAPPAVQSAPPFAQPAPHRPVVPPPSVPPPVAAPPVDVTTARPGGEYGGAEVTERDEHRLARQAEIRVERPAIERLLCAMAWNGGSDLHLSHGERPRMRVSGELLPIAGEPALSSEEIEDMLSEILSDHAWGEFLDKKDLDTSYAMRESLGAATTSRFRINVFRSMSTTGTVIRVIPTEIVTLDDLGVPQQIKALAARPRGLILFTGATGSGKSTTMAGLVDLINETRSERVFTLEDPVEFTHSSKKCLISHREIGEDTPSFDEGLRRVRREDPDVILIGEMRDYQTIAAAIEAADTGHLVIATLHTNSAPETISRIINQFPAAQQDQVRVTLASTLIAVISQTLVKAPSTPRGRVLACEIMMVNSAIKNNIRENDIPAISGALVDQSQGNMSLDAHLAYLIRQGIITKRAALEKCSSVSNLEQMLGNREGGR